MASLFQPRRSSETNGATAADPQLLDSVSIFTWEDAIDLYQGFEWQESASTFFQLSRTVHDDDSKTRCLLNAAIIYARMGKHSQSANVLEEVSTTGDDLALTLFLMGHVKHAMGASTDAEQCFRIALDQLDGKSAKFRDLDFTLNPSNITLNLDTLKESKSSAADSNGLILPADGLLKPVSRPSLRHSTFARNSQSYSKRDGTIVLVFPESPASDITVKAGPPSPVPAHTRIESVEYASGDLKYHNKENEAPSKPESPAPKPASSFRSLSTMVRRISYRQSSKTPNATDANAPPVPTLPRTKPSHTAREARGIGQSVRELTNFIRHLPQQDEGSAATSAWNVSIPTAPTTPASSNAAASSARGSVSSSLPGLTDHESLSDKSIHSAIDSNAASIQSVDAAIHIGSESPDVDLAVPFKNPIRRVVAMERAHKLLADQSRSPPVESTPRMIHQQSTPTMRPVTFIDTVARRPSVDFAMDRRSTDAPRKPPPRPARSPVRHSPATNPPTDPPARRLPPVPPPKGALPAIPQTSLKPPTSPTLPTRRRPVLTERTLSMIGAPLPALPEQSEARQTPSSLLPSQASYFEKYIPNRTPVFQIDSCPQRI
jgi:hypothetical protein